MTYVLDCSFCAALFLPDETSDKVKSSFLKIREADDVFIPFLWRYEMANVLTIAVRRRRLQFIDVVTINKLLHSYNFIVDAASGVAWTEKLLELARVYELSAYDACYLELAIRKQGVVGTLDNKLKAACSQYGLIVL
jgi:predicted nucleic acid-binding protein